MMAGTEFWKKTRSESERRFWRVRTYSSRSAMRARSCSGDAGGTEAAGSPINIKSTLPIVTVFGRDQFLHQSGKSDNSRDRGKSQPGGPGDLGCIYRKFT